MPTSTDDFSSNTSTSGVLVIDGHAQGNFEVLDDVDWFKVHLSAGTTYFFSMTGAAAGGGTLVGSSAVSATMDIYDSGGKYVPQSSAYGGTLEHLPAMPFTPSVDGDYYIGVRGYAAGSYTLSATIGPNDDYGSMVGDTGVITPGTSVNGVIAQVNDRDWFQVQLTAGELYSARVTAASGAHDMFDLSLFDSGGKYIEALQPPTSDVTAVWSSLSGIPAVSGTYYIQVMSWLGAGAYALSVKQLQDDVGDDMASSATLLVGGSFNGRIDVPNDSDWFAINLDAGTGYALSVTSSDSLDPISIIVRDDAGAFNTDVSSGRAFSCVSTGTYYVEVRASQPLVYQISATPLADDFGMTAATAGHFSAAGSAEGKIDYEYDIDCFTYAVHENHLYCVTISSPVSSYHADAGSDNISVLDMIRTSDTWSFKALGTGDLPIWVWDGVRQNYTVTIADIGLDDYGNTQRTAGPLALGVTINGAIETAGDVDVFRVRLEAGVSYLIQAGGNGDDGIAAQLSDENGFSIDYFSFTSHTYTPTKSADYFLTVDSSDHKAASYSASVALASDDYSANAATTGKLAVGGTATGRLESSSDRDWIAVTLVAGKSYVFDASFSDLANNTRPVLELLDGSGKHLSYSSSNDTEKPLIGFTAEASATYYLALNASSYYGGYNAPSAYTLRATQVATDDYPTTYDLPIGVMISGKSEMSNDIDTFRFNLVAGTYYSIETASVDANGNSTPLDSGQYVYSVESKQSLGYTSSSDGVTAVQSLVDGSYAINMNTSADHYTLKVSVITTDDQWKEPRMLALGDSVDGMLEVRNDRDYYKISLHKDQTIDIGLLASDKQGNAVNLTTTQSILRVTGPGGPYQLLDQPFQPNTSKHFSFKATVGGDYTIAVGEYAVQGGYTLQATDIGNDTTRPQLSPSISENGVSGVPYGETISVVFNEPILRGFDFITLFDDNNFLIHTFDAFVGEDLSISGSTLTLHTGINLIPGASYKLIFAAFSICDLAGNPYVNQNKLKVTTVAPAVAASPGDDVFVGKIDGSRIDGGAGQDTVAYQGDQGQYQFSLNGGVISIGRPNTELSADALINIERVAFSHSSLMEALDVGADGVGGQAYRLYQAAFNRAPDKAGVGYWMAALEHGVGLHDVAQGFVSSAEFKGLYGAAPTNRDFVEHLYMNVLHRPGEQAGVDYWIGIMNQGVSGADVLAGFSESPENQAAIAKVIGAGFAYQPYAWH